MMPVAVTGTKGQVARVLLEPARLEFAILTLTRPSFSIGNRDFLLAALIAAKPGVVINAAADTAMDKAESEKDVVMRVNGEGAGHGSETHRAPAQRRVNSCLDNEKLRLVYVAPPRWRESLAERCARLIPQTKENQDA